MINRRAVFEISRWEFSRWFKVKDQLVTLLISCGIGLAVWGGRVLLERAGQEPVHLRVINDHLPGLIAPEASRFTLEDAQAAGESALREAVGRREVEGLLIIRSSGEGELVVYRHPSWKADLEQLLTQARMQGKIGSLGVSPGEIADAFRPFALRVAFHETADRPAGTAEKIAAGVILGLMLIGAFTSFAYQFITITGEKQLRVTEQIISAVTPQEWIDGKILGVAAYSFASLVTYALSILIFIGLSDTFGEGITVPVDIRRPVLVGTLALLGAGGLLFWNTFFAAVAATINDPNTSSRSMMVFLPVVPTVLAVLVGLKNPDAALMQALAIFPLTSPAALSARLVLTRVPVWEVLAAFVLLAGSIWLMRTLAGRIFRIGVLMHGKEPSVREILKWAREP